MAEIYRNPDCNVPARVRVETASYMTKVSTLHLSIPVCCGPTCEGKRCERQYSYMIPIEYVYPKARSSIEKAAAR